MSTELDSRKKITLSVLVQITRDKYYRGKYKIHNSKFQKINTVLIALTVLNKPVKPTEIARFIENNKKNPSLSHQLVVGKDIRSQVKYYLKELTKIGIVEKDKDGYYRLTYKVIPPLPEKDISFYLKHDKLDLSVVLPLLEMIRDSCEQLLDYFQEGGA